MSKQGRPDNARRTRLEAVRVQQGRSERRRTAITVSASVVVAAALVGGSVWAVSRSGAGSSTQGKVALSGLQTYTGLARDHVAGGVAYPQTPPVGGPHAPAWQNCGVYATPVPAENAVHSLEHGAIWITYRPTLPAAQLASIREAIAGQHRTLVSPYPGLPSPVVATAWGVRLRLDSASDPRLTAFLTTYGSGSQAPEPGGRCTGGVGTPTG